MSLLGIKTLPGMPVIICQCLGSDIMKHPLRRALPHGPASVRPAPADSSTVQNECNREYGTAILRSRGQGPTGQKIPKSRIDFGRSSRYNRRRFFDSKARVKPNVPRVITRLLARTIVCTSDSRSDDWMEQLGNSNSSFSMTGVAKVFADDHHFLSLEGPDDLAKKGHRRRHVLGIGPLIEGVARSDLQDEPVFIFR